MDTSSEFSLLPSPKNQLTKRRRPIMLLLPNKRKLEEELTKSLPSKFLNPMLPNFLASSPVKSFKRRLPKKYQLFIQSRTLELERLRSSKDQKLMPLSSLKCTKMIREIFQRLKVEELKAKEDKRERRRKRRPTKLSIC